MFARIFGRAASLRRSLGLGAFLLALAGGVLAVLAALESSASTLLRALQAILGIGAAWRRRSEEHTSELQSRPHLVCRLLLEKKKNDPNLQNSRAPFTFVPGLDND